MIIFVVTLSEEHVSMDHPPEQSDLKKFQSGKGVVKNGLAKKKELRLFIRNPSI